MTEDLELKALKLLSKNFEYNQALHMEADDMAKLLDLKRKEIQPILKSLGQKNFANLYTEGEKVKLAKISWQGLNEIGEVNLKYGHGKDAYENYQAEGYR
ncbi:MAG: hypothetical protein GF317_00750 [Candidatus Lokiarchaeota archaeon]|nr:hypothetical protein [Candidatus Lokiarchaeota archaeon]MBD3198489.1 hypothetical protein [Candidatus Lokiarchaeota archaeon]